MEAQERWQNLVTPLNAAIGLLELEAEAPLRRDVEIVCQQLMHPVFRIAVFGPFNYGKSTLLNALLGERALPIDLIPTTGAAILVRYGVTLSTRIRLHNGTEIEDAGTEILKQFAILDDRRRMREDVASVEVFCPHPFLQTGVELLDLPGTDDQEAQDALVKDQLLTADLIVQVLDGRKLMTLGEREHLRDWLLDRGIETVVFVVNFLNLLELDEQKQVANRLRFVAESFRAKLPMGISNLYRVDALPALRARLKGDMAAAQMAGLPLFESALQSIVQNQQTQQVARLRKVITIAQQVKTLLQDRTTTISTELATVAEKQQKKAEIRQKAHRLITQGFAACLTEFRLWLDRTHLLETYQMEAALALQQGTFRTWETGAFKATAIDHQQTVIKWVHQACEFFDHPRPAQLLIGFPSISDSPSTPNASSPSATPERAASTPDSVAPTAIATGLGWALGGPIGAAVLGGASYLLNRTSPSTSSPLHPSTAPSAPSFQTHLDIAQHYLSHFSALNLATLQRYETTAAPVMQFQPEAIEPTPQHHQLRLFQTTLENLEQGLGQALEE
ncbi:MAG: dynamin family protein [Scytolyngbya sp. HA4215-MV1]|jgi:hypothetical protein|nr:dynamin family protein [Scytolyngbya sp. HA4215-MV1]